jgi:hypothetical protein
MATPTLSNLGTQSTYKIYICDGDGAKGSSNGILANLQNTTDIRRILLEHASQNRALVYESTTYGYTNQEIDGTASAYKYFISDAGGAEGTVPADALDITPYVTNGYKTALYPDANDIALSGTVDNVASGVYTYERRGNLQVLKIDTQSNAAIDNLYRIIETNSQIADKDILIIVGTNTGRAITINDHSIENTEVATASQNICLENSATFSTASPEAQRIYGSANYDKSSLTLMWDATVSLWIEINRAPKSVISRKTLRDASINIPVEGTTVITVGAAGGVDKVTLVNDGGTRTIESGVDPSTLVFEGSITTSNAYTVEKPYGSALEGDKYTAVWNAAWTAGSTNVVTIFGKALTAADALSGNLEITTRYIDGEWEDGKKIIGSEEVEPTLPTPKGNGQILTSTMANVRSWVDSPGTVILASGTYDFAVNEGTANTTFTIGSEVIPAGAIILLDQAIIEMHTALTVSSGVPTISVGYSGASAAVDAIHGAVNFSAEPFNSASTVTRTTPASSGTVVKISATAKTNITVTTANSIALTAGKFTIHVPYIGGTTAKIGGGGGVDIGA